MELPQMYEKLNIPIPPEEFRSPDLIGKLKEKEALEAAKIRAEFESREAEMRKLVELKKKEKELLESQRCEICFCIIS